MANNKEKLNSTPNMTEENPDWHKKTLRFRGAPQWICDDCGRRYGEWYKGKQYVGPTCYFMFQRLGTCDICKGEEIVVAEPRDYGHLRANWDMVKLKHMNDLKNL